MSVIKSGSPPISQKNRPLSLFITGTGGSAGNISGILGGSGTIDPSSIALPSGMVWGYIFFLRPEEVVYNHPTRATVIQTLGGAWVDDFGEGLTEITLSGHTGWRPGSSIGGEEAFLLLRSGCFQLYHSLRMRYANNGMNPDSIQMIFVDTLHLASYVVYPISLQTRKHRTQPLLFKYQMRLIGLRRLL